jgi:hypothetical protein
LRDLKISRACAITELVAVAGGSGCSGGLRVATIPNELLIMLFTAFAPAVSNWSCLEPLRPVLSLPLMTAATKAAIAKHAHIILRGAEKVMVERSDVEKIEWIIMTVAYLRKYFKRSPNRVKYTALWVFKDVIYIFRLSLTDQ